MILLSTTLQEELNIPAIEPGVIEKFFEKLPEKALGLGYKECTLGSERLRTETAAMVATNIIALRNQI